MHDSTPGNGFDAVRAYLLTLQDRLELPMRGRLSIESGRTQLGWEPTYRSIRDGLAEYIERYRAFLAA